MPQLPARFAGIVYTSLRYIASGSSTFSPILKATVGEVGADQHVEPLEGVVEVALDERAHLLRLQVVGVVVAGGERVRAEHDAALDLGAEALARASRTSSITSSRRRASEKPYFTPS